MGQRVRARAGGAAHQARPDGHHPHRCRHECAGTVTFISPRAEFTPRNVQTAEERSKLVYRIKVSADNAAGMLKQGMPVDVEWCCHERHEAPAPAPAGRSS